PFRWLQGLRMGEGQRQRSDRGVHAEQGGLAPHPAAAARLPLPAGPGMRLAERARAHLPALVELRRRLHAVPEVGLDLPRTQATVLEAVKDLGLSVRTGTACSSVVAVLKGGKPGPAVLLRADMDALPIREESGDPVAASSGNMHARGRARPRAGAGGDARPPG